MPSENGVFVKDQALISWWLLGYGSLENAVLTKYVIFFTFDSPSPFIWLGNCVCWIKSLSFSVAFPGLPIWRAVCGHGSFCFCNSNCYCFASFTEIYEQFNQLAESLCRQTFLEQMSWNPILVCCDGKSLEEYLSLVRHSTWCTHMKTIIKVFKRKWLPA